jgi:hypothetical protein
MMGNPRLLAFEKAEIERSEYDAMSCSKWSCWHLVLRSLDWFKNFRKRSAHAIPKAPLPQSPASHGERRSRRIRRPVGLPGAAFVRRLFLSFFVAHNALTGRCVLPLRLWHSGLSSVFSTHVLPAFKIVLFRHGDVLRSLR